MATGGKFLYAKFAPLYFLVPLLPAMWSEALSLGRKSTLEAEY